MSAPPSNPATCERCGFTGPDVKLILGVWNCFDVYACKARRSAPATPSGLDHDLAARKIVLSALAYLEDSASCLFCDLGHVPNDESEPHAEECPLRGYEKTVDCEALGAWVSVPRMGQRKDDEDREKTFRAGFVTGLTAAAQQCDAEEAELQQCQTTFRVMAQRIRGLRYSEQEQLPSDASPAKVVQSTPAPVRHRMRSPGVSWCGDYGPNEGLTDAAENVTCPQCVVDHVVDQNQPTATSKRVLEPRSAKGKDWTVDEKGRSNSSELYLTIVEEVGDMIANHRVGTRGDVTARTIVSRLAHVHGLEPRMAEQPANPTSTWDSKAVSPGQESVEAAGGCGWIDDGAMCVMAANHAGGHFGGKARMAEGKDAAISILRGALEDVLLFEPPGGAGAAWDRAWAALKATSHLTPQAPETMADASPDLSELVDTLRRRSEMCQREAEAQHDRTCYHESTRGFRCEGEATAYENAAALVENWKPTPHPLPEEK